MRTILSFVSRLIWARNLVVRQLQSNRAGKGLPLKNQELPTPVSPDVVPRTPLPERPIRPRTLRPTPTPRQRTNIILRQHLLTPRQIIRQLQQLRMITQLLQHVDRLERLGALAAQELLSVGGLDEVLVEGELEGGEGAEDDVFVLDRDCGKLSGRSKVVGSGEAYGISKASHSFSE